MIAKQKREAPTSVLFEMLSSFVSLARTLNLSASTAELGVSRQTIRRHINDLQKLRGETFFDFHERKYSLTESGSEALLEAEVLLQKCEYWTGDKANSVKGLYVLRQELDDGSPFFAQRHPLHLIWKHAPPLLTKGFRAWASSGFQIEAPDMHKMRPYLVVFRKLKDEWICTEVGEKSAIAGWHGISAAKSAIGTTFETNPLNIGACARIVEAYDAVIRTGSVWYDHISTRQCRQPGKTKLPVSYQRLVFYCEFPDGESAVATLAARTNNILIKGIPTLDFEPMPPQDCMDLVSVT